MNKINIISQSTLKGFGYFSFIEGIKEEFNKRGKTITHSVIPYGYSESFLPYEANPQKCEDYFQEEALNIVNLSLHGIFDRFPKNMKNVVVILHDIELFCPSFGVTNKHKRCTRYIDNPCIYCSEWLGPFFKKGKEIAFNYWIEFINQAAMVVCPSTFIKNIYSKYAPSANLVVIPHFSKHTKKQKKKGTKVLIPSLWSKVDPKVIFVMYELLTMGIEVITITQEEYNLPGGVEIREPMSQTRFHDMCLKEVGVCLNLSLAAESYCLSIDEMKSMGISVVSYPIEVAKERFEKEVSWVSFNDTPKQIAGAVVNVLPKKENTYIPTTVKNYIDSFILKGKIYISKTPIKA